MFRCASLAGESLLEASAAVQADREVVLAAVKQNGSAVQHANSLLWQDEEIMSAAVKQGLRGVSEELRDNKVTPFWPLFDPNLRKKKVIPPR